MIREPAVAGQFYPSSPEELKSMIQGMVDEKAIKEEVIGYYAPHAGYVYSGHVVGATVSRVKFTDTVVILGPSHTGIGAAFSIMTEGLWRTPLGDVEIDTALAKAILTNSSYLREDHVAHLQEHSIEVQLPFIQYFKPDIKFVPILLSHANASVYRSIGKAIAKAIKDSGKEVMIVASGDMNHYESQKITNTKDKQAIGSILKLEVDELLDRVREFKISMCGYGTAACLIYAAKEIGHVNAELVKYQTSGDTTGDFSSVVGYAGILLKAVKESPQVKLARETIESYVRGSGIPHAKDVPPEMQGKAGVFVSLHKGDELRGCIGTIEPAEDSIAAEIINNAISAATRDPRFFPVTADELPQLDYSVDVLTDPEPISSEKELDPKKYGAIVESGWRRGLLLPDLEGVDTVKKQLEICRMKAGIDPNEPVKLYRFEVKRYK
ncbi:MAG: AmmeMemoRadiSam system protein B [Dehalococcoidales bacterium]|nr:AmmeMemoRadiSam system protein B [Dehalococcoidales bacterium]